MCESFNSPYSCQLHGKPERHCNSAGTAIKTLSEPRKGTRGCGTAGRSLVYPPPHQLMEDSKYGPVEWCLRCGVGTGQARTQWPVSQVLESGYHMGTYTDYLSKPSDLHVALFSASVTDKGSSEPPSTLNTFLSLLSSSSLVLSLWTS